MNGACFGDAAFHQTCDHSNRGHVSQASLTPKSKFSIRHPLPYLVPSQEPPPEMAVLIREDIPVRPPHDVNAAMPDKLCQPLKSPMSINSIIDLEDHEETVLMQRNRSRSRNQPEDDEPHENSSDPEARSSKQAAPHSDAHIVTWSFLDFDATQFRHDLPEHIDRPTDAHAAAALGCEQDNIRAGFPVQHINNELEDLVAIVATHQDVFDEATQSVIYAEVHCHRDQPAGILSRPPQIHHAIHVVDRHLTRNEFASGLHLGQLTSAYPWHVIYLHNGIIWETHDFRIRRIQHGDCFAIRLAPHHSPQHRANLTDWLLQANIGLWDSLDSLDDSELLDALPENRIRSEAQSQETQCSIADPFLGVRVPTWYISHTLAARSVDKPNSPPEWEC